MNKRMMKKKFNKWETARIYNMTISFDDLPFIFDAFCAKMNKDISNPMDIYPNEFRKFATSKNVMRAVKSYCKKYVWYSGACDNIKAMYRFMCEEIHKEREYQKHIEEFKRMQSEYEPDDETILDRISVDDVVEASEAYEQTQRSFDMFI